MITRLSREEQGMVLGLAIIVVVVIGVVGAGLLTFVSADLQAVLAVNRGEQAFQLAEAGVEVAKTHLADDPNPSDWSSG
jgi:type II secretory pathway component PulK